MSESTKRRTKAPTADGTPKGDLAAFLYTLKKYCPRLKLRPPQLAAAKAFFSIPRAGGRTTLWALLKHEELSTLELNQHFHKQFGPVRKRTKPLSSPETLTSKRNPVHREKRA